MARIVVVEDDADIAALITHRMRRAGHEPLHAADGLTGLAAVRSSRPDLVLLDWTLPGLSGPEICRAVRATPDLAHVPVIMLSARNQQADLDEAAAAGVNTYLTKPFSARELLALIDSTLGAAARDSA